MNTSCRYLCRSKIALTGQIGGFSLYSDHYPAQISTTRVHQNPYLCKSVDFVASESTISSHVNLDQRN
jgi:hypothetical protein